MTTPPVTSITDELIAELESHISEPGMTALCLSRKQIKNLLAERTELKRDAGRYKFWRYMATHEPAKMARILSFYETSEQLDVAIDAAMQS